jgi:hypothetical protein
MMIVWNWKPSSSTKAKIQYQSLKGNGILKVLINWQVVLWSTMRCLLVLSEISQNIGRPKPVYVNEKEKIL